MGVLWRRRGRRRMTMRTTTTMTTTRPVLFLTARELSFAVLRYYKFHERIVKLDERKAPTMAVAKFLCHGYSNSESLWTAHLLVRLQASSLARSHCTLSPTRRTGAQTGRRGNTITEENQTNDRARETERKERERERALTYLLVTLIENS